MNIRTIICLNRINNLIEMNADLGPLPYIQLNTQTTAVETLEQGIEMAVLVVFEFHEANLRDQLDYDDSSGIYPILSVLPDKFARFLFEFHSCRFESLDLPILPDDRSQFDVHCALEDDKVTQFECL